MNKKVSGLGQTAAGLLLASLVACGGGGGTEPAAPAEAEPVVSSEADATEAVAVFQEEACTICHGEMGEGMAGVGPALQGLAPYWNEERLVAYLQDPEGFRAGNTDFEDRRDEQFELEMPAFDHLSDEQLQLLARWLMAR